MPGGRPPGPLRSYTVSCAWPTSPTRFRVTVAGVDEKTARDSVCALLRMHFSTQVDMAFYSPGRSNEYLGSCMAARWDGSGRVTGQHAGRFQEYIPAWVSGQEPVEREKIGEPELCGS